MLLYTHRECIGCQSDTGTIDKDNNMDNNNNNATGAELVDNLKLAVQFSWHQPGLLLKRLDLWSDVLAQCFEYALQDDWRHVVALPANVTGERGVTEDHVENILDNFNDWLGRHVIYEILAAEVDA